MIQISPQARVFAMPDLLTENPDMDEAIALCTNHGLEPFSGDTFAFRSQDGTVIGVLGYDGQGFHWCIKRFSEAHLAWWPSLVRVEQILARDLQVMLWAGNPMATRLPEMWRPLHGMTGHRRGDPSTAGPDAQ